MTLNQPPSAGDPATPTTSGASRGARAPQPRAWFHFWFSTYGTWLRADERGFRDHDHRIHSSGDYRNPPPKQEHEGLRRWVIKHMRKPPVRLIPALRERIGLAMVLEFEKKEINLLILTVGNDHVHGIAKMPPDRVRALVGRAKIASSHAIRDATPGTVWAKKCQSKRIKSHDQQIDTFRYIERHRNEGAWLWTAPRDARSPDAS